MNRHFGTRVSYLFFLTGGAAIALLVLTQILFAQESGSGFLATWKLLNPQEKQQFISGYLYGWKDAERVTDVALGYIRENPKKAVESLERVKQLYDLSDLKSVAIVDRLDEFFIRPENSNASLSSALIAVQRGQ